MKKMIVFVSVFVLATAALAHPGKTDRYGGHKCLKDCEEWGLYYSEYHLHDRDGKPIRVGRKKNVIPRQEQVESSATATVPFESDAPRTEQTVTVYRYVTVVQEANALSLNPLLLLLLVLLLLWLVIRLNRKREGASER